MRSLSLLSPAKINLYLNILGKRPDGYHEIETVIERISLFDTLKLRLLTANQLKLTCSQPGLQKNNSIARAYRCLKDRLKADFGIEVHLEKNIPVGSGLGGASSNAAFFILGALELLRIRLSQKELYEIGARVGSDVNFFLLRKPFAVCRGRGEVIEAVSLPQRYNHLIIFPEIFSSTKAVYAEFAKGACPKSLGYTRGGSLPELAPKGRVERLTSNFQGVNILLAGLRKRDFPLIENGIFNALKASAYRLHPGLKQVEDVLQKLSAQAYNLTGSGSAFFLFSLVRGSESRLRTLCLRRGWKIYRAHTY